MNREPLSKWVGHIKGELLSSVGESSFLNSGIHFLASHFGAISCSVYVEDQQSSSIVDVQTTSELSACLDDFYNHYTFVNPILPAVKPATDDGRVVRMSDQLSLSRYRNSEFYRDWQKPHSGWFHEAGFAYLSTNGNTAYLTLGREESRDFSNAEMVRLEAIKPIFAKAHWLHAAVQRPVRQDCLIFSGAGQLVHANGPLANYMIQGGWLARPSKGSIFSSHRHELSFRRAEHQLLREGIASFSGADENVSIDVELSLRVGESNSIFQPDICMSLSSPQAVDAVSAFAWLYQLTERERQLCAAINQGMALNEFADQAAISIQTVRTHMKHVFRKTGLNSQLRIVAMINEFSLPRNQRSISR